MTSIEAHVQQPYKYGFVTDIESEVVPAGLNEDVIRLISGKKGEPEWMLDWRLKAYRNSDRGAEASQWGRGGRRVRQCLGRDHLSGGAREVRCDFLSDLASDPGASRSRPAISRHRRSLQRQLLRVIELCGLHGRLVR